MKAFLSFLLVAACSSHVLAQPAPITPSPASPTAASRQKEIRSVLDRIYSQLDGIPSTQVELDNRALGTPAAGEVVPAAAEMKSVPTRTGPPPVPVPTPAAPSTSNSAPPKLPTPPTRPAPTAATSPAGIPAPPAPSATPPIVPPAPGVPRTGRNAGPGAVTVPSLPTAPPAPGLPPGVNLPNVLAAARTNLAGANTRLEAGGEELAEGDQVLGAGDIKFQDTELDPVLEVYQDLTGKTVLRPATLPQAKITIITQTELTRDEAIQALDSILSLNGITMVPQGTKFVKALPTADAPQSAQIFYNADPDELPEAGVYVSYITKLKYADPTEIVQALQEFSSKAPKSIMAIPSTQTLVLRDYAENVKRMLEVIRELDVYVPREYNPVVIPIKYALASDIAQVISSLTEGGGAVTSVGGGQGTGMQRMGTPGGTTGGYRSGTGGYGGSSGYNRSYGTSMGGGYGGYGGVGGVGGYGNTYRGYTDSVTPQSGLTQPVPNQIVPQASFQQRLNQIVSKASEDDIVVLGKTKIIADERTNSLLIFASEEDIETIKDIVERLDVLLAQVLIEAVIIVVDLSDDFQFGVSAAARGESGNWSHFGAVKNPSSGEGSFLDFIGGIAGGTNSSFGNGFSYFGKYNDDLAVAVRALATAGNGKVISNPRVQTSHAVPCNIFVGSTEPYITGTYGGYYGGGYGSQISQLRVGVSLDILPLINPDGLVVMNIQQRIDSVGEFREFDNVGKVPTISEATVNAMVSVRDGETIVLGGFIRLQKNDSNSGVPFLKDIPVLGHLFKSRSKTKKRQELIVLIRPTVLPTPYEASMAAINTQLDMPGVTEAQRDLADQTKKLRSKSSEDLLKREGF